MKLNEIPSDAHVGFDFARNDGNQNSDTSWVEEAELKGGHV